jgi:hypothetical protein
MGCYYSLISGQRGQIITQSFRTVESIFFVLSDFLAAGPLFHELSTFDIRYFSCLLFVSLFMPVQRVSIFSTSFLVAKMQDTGLEMTSFVL